MAVRIEDAYAKAETDKALLVVIDGDQHWIPKSQITDDSEVYAEDHRGDLVITDFIAEQRGLD